jgi:hypothetical protein
VRDEVESKKGSGDAPGLQNEEGHSMGQDESQESDVDPRPGTSDSPGGADDAGQATGNPPTDDSSAGDDDETS